MVMMALIIGCRKAQTVVSRTRWLPPPNEFVYDVNTGRLSEVFPDQETVAG
jgi:hypothetical protein